MLKGSSTATSMCELRGLNKTSGISVLITGQIKLDSSPAARLKPLVSLSKEIRLIGFHYFRRRLNWALWDSLHRKHRGQGTARRVNLDEAGLPGWEERQAALMQGRNPYGPRDFHECCNAPTASPKSIRACCPI
jgi:hypothetical protein